MTNGPATSVEVVEPCPASRPACVRPPVRAYRFGTGHNLTLLGDAFHDTTPARLVKLTQNLFHELGALLSGPRTGASPATRARGQGRVPAAGFRAVAELLELRQDLPRHPPVREPPP